MKINEIICESDSGEEQLANTSMGGNLGPVLMFLRKRCEDSGMVPKMRTASLIQMVKNAGDTSFNYDSLVNAFEENDAIKDMIKNFNENEIVLSSNADEEEDPEHKDQVPADSEQVVDQMAKKAMHSAQ